MVEFVAPLNSKKHRLVPLIRRIGWPPGQSGRAMVVVVCPGSSQPDSGRQNCKVYEVIRASINRTVKPRGLYEKDSRATASLGGTSLGVGSADAEPSTNFGGLHARHSD